MADELRGFTENYKGLSSLLSEIDRQNADSLRKNKENRELLKQINKEHAQINSYVQAQVALDAKVKQYADASIKQKLSLIESEKKQNEQKKLSIDLALQENQKLLEKANAEQDLEKKAIALNRLNSERMSLLREQSNLTGGIKVNEEQMAKAKKAQQLLDEKTLTISERIAKAKQQGVELEAKTAEIEAQRKAGAISDEEADEQKKAAGVAIFGAGGMGGGGGVSGFVETIGGKLGEIMGSKLGGVLGKVLTQVIKSVNAMADAVNQDLVAGVSEINKYMGKMDSRLYGDDKNSFMNILNGILETTQMNPFFSQKDLIKNISEVVDKGIDFNIEQRALLVTLQDKLVSTFDALDDDLLRLIRLQQYDSTESFLGSESLLTMFLNSMFKDTSYLTDMYDSVYTAILDGMSQMNADQATQFNYNVQKWLASLYAVGMSQSAITNIADAINKLATGDISDLAGTEQQTLLALTSTKSGKSYSDLLVQGLQASDVDDLMKSMVEYLQDIANNTNNNVTKSEWSKLLGLTMADWKAVSNLSAEDIASIANSDVTAEKAIDETSNLLTNMIVERTHQSERLDNLIANAKYQFGMTIGQNDALYTTYTIGQVASNLTASLGLGAVGDVISFFTNLSELIQVAKSAWDMVGDIKDTLGTITNQGWQAVALRTLTNTDGTFSYVLTRGNAADAVIDDNGNTTNISSSASISTVHNAFADTETDYEDNYYDDSYEEIETSTEDADVTSMAQSEEALSATTANITSGESVMARDINSLYAALFEDLLAVHVFIDDLSPAAEAKFTASNNSSGIISAVNGIRMA